MLHRRVIAAASLVSGLVALDLHLWKAGVPAAPLACGLGGGSGTAQMSDCG